MMATMEAQQWCEKAENKQEMADIIGRRQWFNVPVPTSSGASRATSTTASAASSPRYATLRHEAFSKTAASVSYPYKSHDAWFLTEEHPLGHAGPDDSTSRLWSTR